MSSAFEAMADMSDRAVQTSDHAALCEAIVEYVSKKRMIEGVALFCNDFEQQGYEVRSGSRLDRRIMYCDFAAQLKALDDSSPHTDFQELLRKFDSLLERPRQGGGGSSAAAAAELPRAPYDADAAMELRSAIQAQCLFARLRSALRSGEGWQALSLTSQRWLRSSAGSRLATQSAHSRPPWPSRTA